MAEVHNDGQEPTEQGENFRAYHNLQYDRIDKLETQRNNLSTIVITLSTLVIGFTFSDISKINIITWVCLPMIYLVANIFAIVYIGTTRKFIKMHQKRANIAREKFAPYLQEINDKVPKHNSDTDLFNRPNLQKLIHFLIILTALGGIIYFIVKSMCDCNR